MFPVARNACALVLQSRYIDEVFCETRQKRDIKEWCPNSGSAATFSGIMRFFGNNLNDILVPFGISSCSVLPRRRLRA